MPKDAALAPEVKLREVWAWSMYDFANSGYTTVVITAVYNAFFVAAIAGGAPWATFAWTAALSLSYLAVLLSAPLIGAWADAHAAKKRLLGFATAGCVLFTAALSLRSTRTLATPPATCGAVTTNSSSSMAAGVSDTLTTVVSFFAIATSGTVWVLNLVWSTDKVWTPTGKSSSKWPTSSLVASTACPAT